MRNCFFLALVACTVFLNAHSLRDNNAHEGLQEDDVPQHQPVVSFQIDLNALGREQLDLVIKTLALGGAVPEGYDLSILPENIQFFVESLLQFPYTQRSLALKQVCPNFANDIDSYRNATAMERILAAALEITNTQLPTFFENLVTDCTQAHGPLTLNSEANYRTWFQDTLRTWFEQQYHARNALTEALKAVFGIEEEENDGMPMDVGRNTGPRRTRPKWDEWRRYAPRPLHKKKKNLT
ncbi:MAG: hypothetical protein H6925_04915 [Holosporaceae bacterium]|nr:MAG: hypothetical protein H6925_04915 [Holosporaceae bacterium]